MCNEGADEFDELMDKEDLQLSQVLDNDDVVSQFSNKNEKLLNLQIFFAINYQSRLK